LKQWYAQPGDRFEVTVDGFVIDIVRDGLLLEVQTKSLASMKRKLTRLLDGHRLRVIYPIAREKWIVRLPRADGSRPTRRKSPRRGRVEDVFWELVSIPQLIANRNFSLEVVMIREEEARRYEAKRRWRRKGWVVDERRLLEVVDRRVFEKPADWLWALPDGPGPFTSTALAETMGISRKLAQKMAYVLRKAGVLEIVGTQARAHLYGVASSG
jgi:hypothetical protein